jgi:hypothetical protein
MTTGNLVAPLQKQKTDPVFLIDLNKKSFIKPFSF